MRQSSVSSRSSRIVVSITLTASVLAAGDAAGRALAVGGRVGTTGIGVEVAGQLFPGVDLRVQANDLVSLSHDSTRGQVDYTLELKPRSAAALLDLHPLPGPFRLTGGFYYDKNELNATSKPTASYQIGDRRYPAFLVGTLSGTARGKELAPYAGIGLGSPVSAGKLFSLSLDLGIIFQGSPEVHLAASGPLAADPSFQADLRREEQKLQDDIKGFRFYPVVSLGVAFQF